MDLNVHFAISGLHEADHVCDPVRVSALGVVFAMHNKSIVLPASSLQMQADIALHLPHLVRFCNSKSALLSGFSSVVLPRLSPLLPEVLRSFSCATSAQLVPQSALLARSAKCTCFQEAANMKRFDCVQSARRSSLLL
jgi:hypothetical protein